MVYSSYGSDNREIALFTVTFSRLHYNAFERECEAISGINGKIARNCLTSTIKFIVMQTRKGNCEKGYYSRITKDLQLPILPFGLVE